MISSLGFRGAVCVCVCVGSRIRVMFAVVEVAFLFNRIGLLKAVGEFLLGGGGDRGTFMYHVTPLLFQLFSSSSS